MNSGSRKKDLSNDMDVSITDLIKTTEFIRTLKENSIKNIDISIH